MNLTLLVLLHGGDDRMDLIYFWSAILMVMLPLIVFTALTYLAVRAYRRRTKAHGPVS